MPPLLLLVQSALIVAVVGPWPGVPGVATVLVTWPLIDRAARARCATTTSACGSSYTFEGVIDSSTASCSDHGTHCASTSVGAEFGVAKRAEVVTVQVLSCSGSGSSSGRLVSQNG